MSNPTRSVRNLVVSALMLALAYILPNFTGNIPQIGSMLLPMHLPVILCGFLCGGPWGAAVGFVAPLMRSLILTRPVMFPTAVAMAFELAAYGFLSGFLYRRLPKNLGHAGRTGDLGQRDRHPPHGGRGLYHGSLRGRRLHQRHPRHHPPADRYPCGGACPPAGQAHPSAGLSHGDSV